LTQSIGVSFFGPKEKETVMRVRLLNAAIGASVYLLVAAGYLIALSGIASKNGK
jgi:hypothetical protein